MHRSVRSVVLLVVALLSFAPLGCSDSDPEAVFLASDTYYSLWDITYLDPAVDTITTAALQIQDDDDEGLYTLPFSFDFYGVTYTDTWPTTNSHVFFGTQDSNYDEVLLDYNTPVAVVWNDDLDSDLLPELLVGVPVGRVVRDGRLRSSRLSRRR